MSGSDATSAYFNPLPPHGGRLNSPWRLDNQESFQSTPSAWRETWNSRRRSVGCWYFNPLPPHGGRLCHLLPILSHLLFQSTPSAWRETEENVHSWFRFNISIHSLRMEGDMRRRMGNGTLSEFQSTPSAWRETIENSSSYTDVLHFNPLPPHGGRRTEEAFV